MNSWFFWLVSLAIILPMASFAYAGEWDALFQDVKPQNIYDLGKQKNKGSIESSASKLHQVKRLDQEILILRAEMSKKNGDVNQVENYVNQLEKQFVLPEFTARVARLKSYLASAPRTSTSLFSMFSMAKSVSLSMDDQNAVVAIVLPVSGVYGEVGLQLQKSLEEGLQRAGFAGKLIALDLALYDSVFEAWEILKYYEPDFIFGPLQKSKIAEWQDLKTGVETLYFNDTTVFTSYEFSLSPAKSAGLEQIFQLLNQGLYQRVLVLKNSDESSQTLEQAFNQAWLKLYLPNDYIAIEINKTIGQSIDEGLNVEKSKERQAVLKRNLQQTLEFAPRVRKDIEAVVSFIPQNQAIQVAPYLNFLSTTESITHIWYPSKTPSVSYLMNHLDAWQQTFAILSPFLAETFQNNSPSSHLSSKNGLFHALGQVAIEIVNKPNESSNVDSLVDTAYGTYVRNANGQFHLLPNVYWVDNGIFEKFVSETE